MSQTIIVSNRLPVSVRKSKEGLEIYPSSGGLATGLSSYASKQGNLWIGWPGVVSDDLTDADRKEITRRLAEFHCQPVFLSQKQLDDFYNGYSNSILWPFLHNLKTSYENEARYWKAYREVNELFCDAVMDLSKPGSTIWVHDYQLLLLPKMLREHRPEDSIGFFMHIPFPDAEHFTSLNNGASLLKGMLGADLVGFHTKEYAKHFLDSCYRLTGAAPTAGGVALKERAVRVTDFPMGIDYVKFSNAYRTQAVQHEYKRLKRLYRNRSIILTVDRLDPTKGFVERLDAYRTLLEQNKDLHKKVVMVMLAVPSRGDIEAYKELKANVEKLVRSINRTFGTRTWTPVEYRYESVPFEELSAMYRAADIAFVAPIKDGMNLVAKEYIASHGRSNGILILSETAGAAQELKEALLVNPHEPKTLVRALKHAVKMKPTELKQRVGAMHDVLASNTVHDWAGSFMGSLKKSRTIAQTPQLNEVRQRNLIRNYKGAQSRLLLFDYDGVLAPFASRPEDAAPSKHLLKLLKRLAETPKTHVAIISGRSQENLEEWFGHLPVTLGAEHGATMKRGKTWKSLAEPETSWKKQIRPVLRKFANETPGALFEEKAYSLVWHFRRVTPYLAQKNITVLKTILRPMLRKHGLTLFRGQKILEIKDPNVHKGTVAKSLLDTPYDFILCIGDDFTDEDMFTSLPKRAFTLKVGRGKTAARYRIKNVSEVRDLLEQL